MAGDDRIIIRTAARSTLGLARSLSEDGFDAWTPQEIAVTLKTRRKPSVETPVAMLPTFVFAAASDLQQLTILRRRVSTKHAPFSIFRHAGRIPVIEDRSLDALRRLEQRAADRHQTELRRREKPPEWRAGQTVTSSDPSFAGLEGVVSDQQGRFVLVSFGGRYVFKISAWLLCSVEVDQCAPAAA